MQATPTDVLWAKKAVLKKLTDEVKADEDALKAQLVANYKAGMGDRMRSPMFGSKSGYITVKEGKPSEHVTKFQVGDMDALVDWMDEARPDTDCFAADNIALFAEWYFKATGELPDGCQLIQYDTEPGEPVAMCRVKNDDVIEQLRNDEGKRAALSAAVPMLLGDGNGD